MKHALYITVATCCALLAVMSEVSALEPVAVSGGRSGQRAISPLLQGLASLGASPAPADVVHVAKPRRAGGKASAATRSDSLDKWHLVRAERPSGGLGFGGNSLVAAEGPDRNGTGVTGIGGSVPLSDQVSLRLEGRYQSRGENNLGGNVGFKIRF